jgi:disulfide oxidoreductase YuzD
MLVWTEWKKGEVGRKFIGTELKPQYWDLACQNIADAEKEQHGLFSDVFEELAA